MSLIRDLVSREKEKENGEEVLVCGQKGGWKSK